MSISVETTERLETRDVTAAVGAEIPSTLETGICVCTVQHTTAALVVQEPEERLRRDIEAFLGDLVPETGWAHDQLDGNADAHLRATLLGPTVTLPVTEGHLDLGTWQSVLLVECDGPRRRTITVRTVSGEHGD